MKRPDPKASTINTISVTSIDESIAKVNKGGGKVTTEKMPIPGIGIFAYCLDTEGNTFGILQPEMPAPK